MCNSLLLAIEIGMNYRPKSIALCMCRLCQDDFKLLTAEVQTFYFVFSFFRRILLLHLEEKKIHYFIKLFFVHVVPGFFFIFNKTYNNYT